jgi:ElaB/YqjD/DUF883 family membrane-anchored ribosome-binding protein
MDNRTQTMGEDMSASGQDAEALLAATAGIAGEKVEEARNRLAAALESGKEIYNRVREQAVEGAKVADQSIRKNPYQAIGIALGVGLLLGYLISRRGPRIGD